MTSLVSIDAAGVHYRRLNELIRDAIADGAGRIELLNVNGQRFICAGLEAPVHVDVHGVPGNDLGVFADGPIINCLRNVQDGTGNTMNSGQVVVHGNAGDVLGYGLRGGRVFIRGDVGYRVGIHMKEFKTKIPAIIVGGRAGNFLAEYMAGGTLVVLGLDQDEDKPVVGSYCGTGMHGGLAFVRRPIEDWQLGKEVGMAEVDNDDRERLTPLLEEFCALFDVDKANVLPMLEDGRLAKLFPRSRRPYGNLYSY